MNKLNKLKLILDTVKDHNITAYEIGKNTKISTFAIQKILKGETKKPNELTLDTILNFLQEATVGTNYKENNEVISFKESPTPYFRNQKPATLIEELQARIISLSDELQEAYRTIAELNRKLENNIDK